MSDFDHCKENIQPQRRGHSSAELMNLNRLNDPEYRAKVKAEEMEWEQRLRLDESDIQVWSEYIEWAEMNVYSQLQLNELKQKAMAKFIKPEFENLANDNRLFEIFLKSIDKSKNWRDIFSFARSKSFFLKLSSFWTHWAERFELDGCVKQADAILEQGESYLSNDSNELKKLEQWRQNFDLRIASGRSLHIEREEEDRPRRPQRRGLGLIETKKSSTKPVASKKKQTSLFVYQDGSEDNPNPAGLTGDWISDTIPKNRNLKGKENRDYATAWSEPSSAKACPLVSRPRVNILEVPDLDTKEEPKVQVQLDKKPLKEKKRKSEDVFMQLIKDEESKSKEIPMYRKDEIYLGLKETSFEELKAQKWMKLQKLAQNARTPTQHKLNHDKIARNDHIEFNMDESLSDLKSCGNDLLDGNDDLVCGILPDTPKTRPKKSKFLIFED